VAEGARLESVFTRKGNVGSNPTLSAKYSIYNYFFFNELGEINIVHPYCKTIPRISVGVEE
jgi:hypothetical protein